VGDRGHLSIITIGVAAADAATAGAGAVRTPAIVVSLAVVVIERVSGGASAEVGPRTFGGQLIQQIRCAPPPFPRRQEGGASQVYNRGTLKR
jgi:hypothetical protein